MTKNKTINGSFFFDPQDPIYNVHFPSFPVVPGSLIIDAFFKAMKKILPTNSKIIIKNFKFIKFVKPGSCDYIIEQFNTNWKCQLFQNEKLVAKGKITYAA